MILLLNGTKPRYFGKTFPIVHCMEIHNIFFFFFFRQLQYEDAVVECARRGSIILPVKDQEMHSFITKWASITGGDVWIGLQRKRWGQYFDENPAYNQPLQEVIEGINHSIK